MIFELDCTGQAGSRSMSSLETESSGSHRTSHHVRCSSKGTFPLLEPLFTDTFDLMPDRPSPGKDEPSRDEKRGCARSDEGQGRRIMDI